MYEDGKGSNEPGPGIVEVEKLKLLGKGEMMLRNEGRYIDSVLMNKDPFEVKEGSEKYKQWKKVFDMIGRELE